jgi:hypothetical protein
MKNYYNGQTKASIEVSELIINYISCKCPKKPIEKEDYINLIESIKYLKEECIKECMNNEDGLYDVFLKGKEDLYSEIKEVLEDYLYI